MNDFSRQVLHRVIGSLHGYVEPKTPLELQHEDQCLRLMERLLPVLRNRHFGDKQLWYELHWSHLHALGMANPHRYHWDGIGQSVQRQIKDRLLSSGYGVSTPPAPHEHAGVLITWRAELYSRKE